MAWRPVVGKGNSESSPVYAYTDGTVNIVKHREAGVERYMIAVLPGSLERMKEKHPPVRSWHGPFDTSAAAIAFYRARRDEVLTATDNVARS